MVGFPRKPWQRVISGQVFKVQGRQMGLHVVKDQHKVSDIPGPFQNVFRRAWSHGVFCKAFHDCISQEKTRDCFQERKKNKQKDAI